MSLPQQTEAEVKSRVARSEDVQHSFRNEARSQSRSQNPMSMSASCPCPESLPISPHAMSDIYGQLNPRNVDAIPLQSLNRPSAFAMPGSESHVPGHKTRNAGMDGGKWATVRRLWQVSSCYHNQTFGRDITILTLMTAIICCRLSGLPYTASLLHQPPDLRRALPSIVLPQ